MFCAIYSPRRHGAAEPRPKYKRADLKLRRSRMFIDNNNQMTVSSLRSEMFKKNQGPRDLHYAPKRAIEHLRLLVVYKHRIPTGFRRLKDLAKKKQEVGPLLHGEHGG